MNLGTAAPHASLTGVKKASPVNSIALIVVLSNTTLAYDLAQTNGQVESLGGAAYYGSAYGVHLVQPIVCLLATSDRKGYWLIGADASVFPYGDAQYEGDAGGTVRSSPIVAAAATPDDRGYWMVTSLGHVLAFGDAKNYGQVSTTSMGMPSRSCPRSTARATG